MLDRTSRYGDWQRQKKICNKLIEIRKKSGVSLVSKDHLQIIQLLIATELILENYSKVSTLIHNATPIAEKYEDTEIFKAFQINKANYFLALAERNQTDITFKEPNGFWSWLFTSEEKKLTKKETSLFLAKKALLEIVDLSFKPKGDYFNDFEITTYLTYCKLLNLNGRNKKAFDTLKKISKYLSPKSSNKFAQEIKFSLALFESIQSPSKKKEMDNIVENLFNDFYNHFTLLNDIDREKILLNFETKINSINHRYLLTNKPNYIESVLNNSLKIKDLSLISQLQINNYLKNQTKPKFKKYQILTEKYRELQNSSSFNDRQKLEEVRRQIFVLHQELNMPNVLKNGLKLAISWKDIKSKLTSEELAIEIIRVPNQKNSEVIYYGILFSSSSTKPELVKLFYESKLEEVLNCSGNTEERIKCLLETNSKKLYNLIFEPISKYMVGKKFIYVSKTGLLHSVPLGSITLNSNWILKSVSSLQSILSDDIHFRLDGADLFGGADFARYNDAQRHFSYQVSMEVQDLLRNKKIANLLHSKTEVLKIKELYDSLGRKNDIYTESKANEYSFRNLSGEKNDVIHVATHGFSEGLSYNVNSTFNSNNNAISELLRSGILLSPHSSQKGLNDKNDGLITAMDLSKLDFSNYNLVIFSSCESGLGNLYGNQGVYGIVRGLKLAGVKSMILSLWKVPDKQTSELMIAFYKYYLKGDHPIEALKKAKIELKSVYPNPYYWAGFEYFE